MLGFGDLIKSKGQARKNISVETENGEWERISCLVWVFTALGLGMGFLMGIYLIGCPKSVKYEFYFIPNSALYFQWNYYFALLREIREKWKNPTWSNGVSMI